MYVVVGTYTGDASDNRPITGLGFPPEFVIIKGAAARSGVARSTGFSGDETKDLGNNVVPAVNQIQSLDADGFTLGTSAQVNAAGETYFYLAVGDTNVSHIAYVGNATDNRNLTGAGLDPDLAMVFEIGGSATTQFPRFRTADMPADPGTSSVAFGAVAAQADRLQALIADGIQVSADNSLNESGVNYDAPVFKEEAGVFEIFTYTGDGSDNRNLGSLVSFTPDFALVKAHSTTSVAVMRFKDEVGDLSLPVTAIAETANLIQAFISGGIQVGTDSRVNQNTIVYYGFAFKAAAAPPSTPARLTKVANAGTTPSAGWGDGITDLTGPAVNLPSTGQVLTIIRG